MVFPNLYCFSIAFALGQLHTMTSINRDRKRNAVTYHDLSWALALGLGFQWISAEFCTGKNCTWDPNHAPLGTDQTGLAFQIFPARVTDFARHSGHHSDHSTHCWSNDDMCWLCWKKNKSCCAKIMGPGGNCMKLLIHAPCFCSFLLRSIALKKGCLDLEMGTHWEHYLSSRLQISPDIAKCKPLAVQNVGCLWLLSPFIGNYGDIWGLLLTVSLSILVHLRWLQSVLQLLQDAQVEVMVRDQNVSTEQTFAAASWYLLTRLWKSLCRSVTLFSTPCCTMSGRDLSLSLHTLTNFDQLWATLTKGQGWIGVSGTMPSRSEMANRPHTQAKDCNRSKAGRNHPAWETND